MFLILPLKKAFVKVPASANHRAYSYFNNRQKKVTHVKHTKKTRVDYSEKDAKLKIQFLNAKKNHHNSQIEAAKELKEKVASHKAKGNTTFKMGDKHHDIHKVTKDLNNHIEHHSNEVQSHDNHISKIKDRYKTDREYFTRKKSDKPKESGPVYKLEKVGNKYNIHYPTFKGTQGLIEGRTIREAKEFFERQGNKAGDFEGKEHLSGKKPPAKKIVVEKDIDSKIGKAKEALKNKPPSDAVSKGSKLLSSGKGKGWSKSGSYIVSRTYFGYETTKTVMGEAKIKFPDYGVEQIYYDHGKKEWGSKDFGPRKLKALNEFLEPKSKEQTKLKSLTQSKKNKEEKTGAIAKYGIKPKTLTGTTKQKSWANTIRSKIIDSEELTKDQTKDLLEAGGFTNTAKFWINNKDVSPSEFTFDNLERQYIGFKELENKHRDFLSRTNPTYEKDQKRNEIKDYLENSTFKFESDLV